MALPRGATLEMTDSPESTAFQRCFDVLQIGLQGDLYSIVSKVFAKNLISESSMKWASSIHRTRDEKSLFLAGELLDKVRVEPSSFYRIIGEIDACPALNPLANRLREELKQVQEEQKQVKDEQKQLHPPWSAPVSVHVGMLSTGG